MIYALEVGALVRMTGQPDWGIGQVQSIIGDRVTVNFEHKGKILFRGNAPLLEIIAPDNL